MQADGLAKLDVAGEGDLIALRREITRHATEAGLGMVQKTKFVTAASELARNILRHADRGHVSIHALRHQGRRGLSAAFVDRGPGIADVEAALTDGYSTGHGMGLGLPGARRLVHELTIETQPGKGSTVTIIVWADR